MPLYPFSFLVEGGALSTLFINVLLDLPSPLPFSGVYPVSSLLYILPPPLLPTLPLIYSTPRSPQQSFTLVIAVSSIYPSTTLHKSLYPQIPCIAPHIFSLITFKLKSWDSNHFTLNVLHQPCTDIHHKNFCEGIMITRLPEVHTPCDIMSDLLIFVRSSIWLQDHPSVTHGLIYVCVFLVTSLCGVSE